MGMEWLYRVGGGGKSTKKGSSGGGGAETEAATPGCMCSVFQLFDLHNQPVLKPHYSNFFQDDESASTVLKGVEAPRNSLELEETNFAEAGSSLSSTMKEEANLNIPMGLQITTVVESRSPRASTSECSSSSPGTNTPNLVARLMGLDLLPEISGNRSPLMPSSRHSASNILTNSHMHSQGQSQEQHHLHSRQFISCITRSNLFDADSLGTFSLPETPKISVARRSDVDHRLSLQLSKENIAEEFELSSLTVRKMGWRRDVKQEDENRSPGYYARQIVKQVRESVNRKVGLDITNTIKSREQRRDDHVVLLKPKKPSTLFTRVVGDDSSPSKQSTPSCSPRLRFLDSKNKPVATSVTKNKSSHSPRLSTLPLTPENQSQVLPAKVLPELKPQVPPEKQQNDEQKPKQICKKAGTERFNSRLRKLPQASDAILNYKKEEPFIRSTSTNKGRVSDKKCKKTPLSNELFNISVPTLLMVKKDPPLPRTKDKQSLASDALSRERRSTQLSSCSSRSYEEETPTLRFQENIQARCNGSSTSVAEVEYQYIQRILKRTGINKASPVSQAKWFSPSHPLDPSIYHYIELFHPATATTTKLSKLSHQRSRKLIFQLVDELLMEILEPWIYLEPWMSASSQFAPQMDGSQLIETLCARIGNFPEANCQVLEDIDALIDKDLRKSQHAYYYKGEGEVEGVVSDIEREIVESLVHETAILVLGIGDENNEDLTKVTW